MKRTLALLIAVVMTLSLAACKSDSNTAQTNAQGVFDDKILVASSAATSGAWATTGDPIVAGVKAYFDMVNAEGGIDGRKIEFIHEDDEFDAIKAKSYFQQFLEDDKVFGLVATFGQVPVAAILEDLHASGMPAVYFASSISNLYNEKATTLADGANCYPIQPIYMTEAQVMVSRAAATWSAKNIGVIYTNDETGSDLFAGAKKQAEELGLSIVGEQVQLDAPDVSAAITSLKNQGIDTLIVGAAQTTMPTIIKEQAKQALYVPTFITYVTSVRAMAEQIAEDVGDNFPVYSTGWMAFTDETRYNEMLLAQEWLPDEYDLNGYAFCGWVGASFFCEGLRRLEGKPVTWESYKEAMESAPIHIPMGANVDYANGSRVGVQEMTLVKLDLSSTTGFAEVDTFRTVEELLAMAKQ